MPSVNQSQGSGSDYRNIWHRVFTTDMDPYPLLNGVRGIDRAVTAWNEANRCGADEGVKEDIQTLMENLRE